MNNETIENVNLAELNSTGTNTKPITRKSSECSQLLNVNIVNEEASSSNNIKQVSSSLLSISSVTNKKFKNSNLSLNKKISNNAASNLLSTIKNSTLNVLGKPLSSRTPSKSSIRAAQDKKKTNENGSENSSYNEEDEDFSDFDNEKELKSKNKNRKLRKAKKLDDKEHDSLDESAFLTCKREFKFASKRASLLRNRASILSNEDLCEEVEEEDDDEEEEEDDDEYENIESMVGDEEHSSRQKVKETSKLNTASVPKRSLKTLSNCTSSSASITPNQANLKVNQSVNLQHNDLDKSSNLNKPIKLSITNNINKTLTNEKNFLSVQTATTNPKTGNCTSSNNPSNQPLKTILSNSNRNLDSSVSRQSVSFSEDTFSNLNNYKTMTNVNIQRNQSIDEQDNNTNSKREFSKQDSVMSAPASTQNYSNQIEIDINRLNKSSTVTDYENLNEKVKPNQINMDLMLSSSFASTNTAFNSSYSPSFANRPLLPQQQPQVPIKILHKTMTKGSKAMRIMGSNNTGMMSNGMLKNSTSSGAVSMKSNSSRSASNKKQQQKRLFFKNGNINISRCNIDKRRRRYLTDIFTTLIDLKWRYNILVFVLGFFVSWTLFAITWYMISYIHGDLESNAKNRTVCISGINGFAGAILFSIETQQTIGYGVRFTTEKCPEAILVMMIQSSVGVMIQSFMVGVVFAKLSRPKKRSETLMFSKNAVISLRDGRLCLICRVGDMRKSHIVEAHVRMYLIKKKVTLEGEIMPLHMYDLNVGWDKGLDRLFLVWPLTIEHNIDENSPFWTISAEDLKKERFELAVILEGIVESTGMTTQARSSYLVNEILWGHRFEKLITFQKEDGTYKIDYSRFDMTVPIDTPTCSAKELAELREQEKYFNLVNLNDSTPSTINSRELTTAGNNSDLRKRRVEQSNKQEEENYEISTQTTNATITNNNNIRMVIEDHSSDLPKPIEYYLNEDALFDNMSNFNPNLNSTPNPNSAEQENNTQRSLNLIDQNNQFFDNQLTTCI